MRLKEIISALEQLAPPSYQESYDNSGLITGNESMVITGALICLDSLENIIDEAIKKNCNLVIAHHPIVFTGLKKINGNSYNERVIIKAIKNDIAIYAIHTNLDNVFEGVNAKICEKLGLINCKILSPQNNQLGKLITYAPVSHAEKVKQALFDAGAGNIGNYSECSFTWEGLGSFKGNNESKPFIGEINKLHIEKETRIEVLYPKDLESKIVAELKKNHPYEEVAYELLLIANKNQFLGAGMVGELPSAIEPKDFLLLLKKAMNTACIRFTTPLKDPITKIAVCGGSGSFLLLNAIQSGAQVFVSADFKYHQFFDADGKIMIADIGHFETEQFTNDLIGAYLREKFPKFAVHLTELNTNPINYI